MNMAEPQNPRPDRTTDKSAQDSKHVASATTKSIQGLDHSAMMRDGTSTDSSITAVNFDPRFSSQQAFSLCNPRLTAGGADRDMTNLTISSPLSASNDNVASSMIPPLNITFGSAIHATSAISNPLTITQVSSANTSHVTPPQEHQRFTCSSTFNNTIVTIPDNDFLESDSLVSHLQEFTLFGLLPTELRLQIWEVVPYTPRVIGLYPHPPVEATQFKSSSLAPPVLHATRESRSVALKSFEQVEFLNAYVMINWKLDTLFLGPRKRLAPATDNEHLARKEIEKKCCNMAAQQISGRATTMPLNHGRFFFFLRSFTSLKRLTILIVDEGETERITEITPLPRVRFLPLSSDLKASFYGNRFPVYEQFYKDIQEDNANSIELVEMVEYRIEPDDGL